VTNQARLIVLPERVKHALRALPIRQSDPRGPILERLLRALETSKLEGLSFHDFVARASLLRLTA
jgi:hypothetical protein